MPLRFNLAFALVLIACTRHSAFAHLVLPSDTIAKSDAVVSTAHPKPTPEGSSVEALENAFPSIAFADKSGGASFDSGGAPPSPPPPVAHHEKGKTQVEKENTNATLWDMVDFAPDEVWDQADRDDVALNVGIMNSFIFGLFLGPSNLFAGQLVSKISIITQALEASGYQKLLNSMVTISAADYFDVFEALVFTVTGTITMSLATIENQGVNNVMKGMIGGYTSLAPLADSSRGMISHFLFQNVAGCNDLGERTLDFPLGIPVCTESKWRDSTVESGEQGCTHCLPGAQFKDWRFLSIFYLMKAAIWIATLSCGYFATKFSSFFNVFTSSILGADLMVKAWSDLAYNILLQYDRSKAMYAHEYLLMAKAVLIYLFAAGGYMVQRGMNVRTIPHTVVVNGVRMPNVKGHDFKSLRDVPTEPGVGGVLSRLVLNSCLLDMIYTRVKSVDAYIEENMAKKYAPETGSDTVPLVPVSNAANGRGSFL
jgi:hypothetical protein